MQIYLEVMSKEQFHNVITVDKNWGSNQPELLLRTMLFWVGDHVLCDAMSTPNPPVFMY